MRDSSAMERMVLGGMLENLPALKDGLNSLTASTFRMHSNQIIFEAIKSLDEAKQPVEMAALVQHLNQRNLMEEVGGFGYVMDVAESAVRNQDIRHYIREVKEGHALYRIAQVAERVMMEASQGQRSSGELTADLEEVAKLVQQDASEDMTTMDDLIPRVMNRILNSESRPLPMSTGLPGLDANTMGGIRPGELWVWGGLPGRGKTSVARQVARSVASAGWDTAVFTIEMPDEEWGELDVSAVSGVPAWKIRKQSMNREERQAVIEAGEKMIRWPMRYEDSGSLHIRTLIAKARVSVMRRQTKLLVVDYVQRVKTNDKEVRHRIGNVAEALAEFAKEYKCAVVLLSQLARKGDVNSRPSMQDLKESGELEAHAHCVLLNYRPVDKEATSETVEEFTGYDEIIIAKQRHGPMGSVKVCYNPDFLIFEPR